MTVEMFLILLTVFSTATSLFTEAVKKLLDGMNAKYTSNIVVLIVSVVVGGAGMVGYYLVNGVEWTTLNIVSIVLMMGANWIGSMVGYDKVKQAISQFKAN